LGAEVGSLRFPVEFEQSSERKPDASDFRRWFAVPLVIAGRAVKIAQRQLFQRDRAGRIRGRKWRESAVELLREQAVIPLQALGRLVFAEIVVSSVDADDAEVLRLEMAIGGRSLGGRPST
jgi:hypothetical protein